MWVEATSKVVYIHNRSLYAVLDEKKPKVVFTGEKLDISHLQIFGCPMYIHIPKEKRTNMETFINKGPFVGYNETSKGFKIYVPVEGHVEVSWDVTFHEEVAFKQSKELECDLETEEIEDPISEDHDDDSSPFDFQRENPTEHAKLPIVDEPIELDDEPPTKRRSAWC